MATSADNSRMTFEAVLFDCDGVLVDSEAITCGALRDMLDENGWRLSLAECMAHFVGHTVRSRAALIEANTGKPLTDSFMNEFYRRRNLRLENDITAIDGIHDAVRHLHERCEGRIAVASGADRYKVEMMLQRVGLAPFFEGRIFSGHEMPRSKPHPDVYLAAAARCKWPQSIAWWWKTHPWVSPPAWRLVQRCGPMRRLSRLPMCWCRRAPNMCLRT